MYEMRRAFFEVFRVLVLVLVVCALGYLCGLYWCLDDELQEQRLEASAWRWDTEQMLLELDDRKVEVSRAAE